MRNNCFSIIEIGSNNTKTHIYENDKNIYERNDTIEFKKNYMEFGSIIEEDIEKLELVIKKSKEFTEDIYLYGCSIFRNISKEELIQINKKIKDDFKIEIKVVSQADEAMYTSLGCYNDITYKGNICVFIGGGGSTEIIFINDKKIIDKKFYDFGVVDILKKFPDLKNDVPDTKFNEVNNYIEKLIEEDDITKSDLLILAGGDYLYWYNSVGYKLLNNDLYESENQKFMITREMSDKYDEDSYKISLDNIRQNSDNPKWFDGARAMRALTNYISHKVDAKYIIPTKINMGNGLKSDIINSRKK